MLYCCLSPEMHRNQAGYTISIQYCRCRAVGKAGADPHSRRHHADDYVQNTSRKHSRLTSHLAIKGSSVQSQLTNAIFEDGLLASLEWCPDSCLLIILLPIALTWYAVCTYRSRLCCDHLPSLLPPPIPWTETMRGICRHCLRTRLYVDRKLGSRVFPTT